MSLLDFSTADPSNVRTEHIDKLAGERTPSDNVADRLYQRDHQPNAFAQYGVVFGGTIAATTALCAAIEAARPGTFYQIVEQGQQLLQYISQIN